MKAVILAGGSGERFWPLSTPGQPKQFLELFGERTLIRSTYDRLVRRLDPSDLIIVTSGRHVEMTRKELPDVPAGNMIGEPVGMNTAPACVVGSMKANEGEPVLTVPADHMIPDTEGFWKIIDQGLAALDDVGGLFTFGIEPTRPESGYGYIEVGNNLSGNGFEAASFREKPDRSKAQEFLLSGRFLWNSGMFLWTPEELFGEMRSCCPEVIAPLEGIDPDDPVEMEKAYSRTQRISIDNALMERSSRVRVVPADLEWSDVGSWDSLMELEGVSGEGTDLALPGSGNIYFRSSTGRKAAVVGLEDLIVVDSPEGLLICAAGRSQKVKDAVKHFNRPEKGK